MDQILITRPSDGPLGRAIMQRASKLQRVRKEADVQEIEAIFSNDKHRIGARRALFGNNVGDPNALERLIGKNDLCSISYLGMGQSASAAVARIRVKDASTGKEMFGTGFLVAPGLLMTNHHVLQSKSVAEMAVVEFNYEHDTDGVERQRFVFNLSPGVVFVSDAVLDVTIVEVVPRSLEGKPLSDFGFLPLFRHSGKALEGEYVSIIQHPEGQHKQIAIRDSQIVTLAKAQFKNLNPDRLVHYTTDTQPGSSGSPVLNDQWQVVALHRRGVPMMDSKGRLLCRDHKSLWHDAMGLDQLGWAANEGVRVSAICRWLQEERYTSSMHDSAYHRVRFGVPRQNDASQLEEMALERSGGTSSPSALKHRDGYDDNFLSQQVPLPTIVKRTSAIAKLLNQPSEFELKYTHFSVVFDKDRRFARLTAVNIDGNRLVRNSGVKTAWKRDGRIVEDIQPDDDFYAEKVDGRVIEEVVYFQRGHLVRRVDPSWGPKSVQAVKDTFHFTNACPHTGEFNDRIWGNLEDYLLEKCDREKKRMSVFSGPVFRSGDPKTYGRRRPGGPYEIPVDYWKVAVVQKDADTVAAAAFVIGQLEQLGDLEAGAVFSGLHPFKPADLISQGIQTRIEKVEQLTGLDFGALKNLQTGTGLESTTSFRYLYEPSQILI